VDGRSTQIASNQPEFQLTQQDDQAIWDNAQAKFYLSGIEQSDYASKVGSAIQTRIGLQSSFLDVGAGAGTLAKKLLADDAIYTAIEPNGFLANHLESKAPEWPFNVHVLQKIWQQVAPASLPKSDVSLAANTPAPLQNPYTFWHWMRQFTQHTMIWVVPNQNGPHGACLSGFLPATLHGEIEQSPLPDVLSALGDELKPHHIEYVDWSFSVRFETLAEAENYFQHRFNSEADLTKATTLNTYLQHHLKPSSGGYLATAPKSSALLFWNLNQEFFL